MRISSNEIPCRNQLVRSGVTHKFYIQTEAPEFYQCGANPTFIFQLSMLDKLLLLQVQQ